jgi:hypothetical protein
MTSDEKQTSRNILQIHRAENEKITLIKGIVSRDWGRLQMGSLNRSEFRSIPLEVYF